MARGGKREGAGRKRSYEAYKRQYKAKEKQLAANGVDMNQRMLTESEFKAQYDRMLNSRKKDVANGSRKTTGNITRDLVDKQAFAISNKQYKKLIEKTDENLLKKYNYYEKRSGLAIEEYEAEKVDEYLNKNSGADIDDALSYARGEISTALFGS